MGLKVTKKEVEIIDLEDGRRIENYEKNLTLLHFSSKTREKRVKKDVMTTY